MRRFFIVLFAVGLTLALSAAVQAATILGFEVGDSFTHNGLTVTFERWEDATNSTLPTDAVELDGAVGATDMILVFTATGTGVDIDELGIGIIHCEPGPWDDETGNIFVDCAESGIGDFGRNTTAGGWGPDPGTGEVDIDNITGTADTRIFQFDGDADGEGNDDGFINGTEQSDEFWVSYALGDIDFNGTFYINFMISNVTDLTQSVQLTPEPSTALMLAAGLAGLGIARRRQR